MHMVIAILVILIVGAALWVRIAPSDPDDWHVDPLTAEDPGIGGVLRLPGSDAKTYPASPTALLTAFDRVVLSQPRTERLSGSVREGMITYVTRTKWMGFPDYVTIKAVPNEDGTQLAAYSRLRFGRGDMGVNEKRLDRWMKLLQAQIE
ncbi:DUF1499 domain-containing protein [Pseudoruegeria sp. HB172150]|uniref:DUF1499 domain-containing protein n=1 Tax=Pseudoruegeria sp. HB172150 TaxID=2721164 RepID=UPI0015522B4B|nr:DUF1499 domain-containing protein [Pseudoruegeria sp. HB172150]